MTLSLSVLLGTCPAQGHVQPLLPLARGLVEAGHQVRWLTGRRFADAVTATGAQWLPLPDAADFDDTLLDEEFPGRSRLRGLSLAHHDLALFVDAIPAQHDAIRDAMRDRAVDVLIPDQMFLGALPLLSLPRQMRPAILVAGIMPLTIGGADIPLGGALPMGGLVGRWRNRAIRAGFMAAFGRVQRSAEEHVGRAGGRLAGPWVEAAAGADAILALTVAGLEYPRPWLNTPIHFVGSLTSSRASRFPLPAWWHELDPATPLVLVTQGTIANRDLADLVRPTIQGLASEPCVTVSALAGGDPAQLGLLPDNARVADYLPLDEVLPRSAVMVSNGGYGGVNLALRHGIPLVLSGVTEDKAEVARRVRWAGVGATTRRHPPSPADVCRTVRTVVGDQTIRSRARELQRQYADAPGVPGAVSVVERLASHD